MTYTLISRNKILATEETPEHERVTIPFSFHKRCFWDRFWNRDVQVYQNDRLVFNWPARKLPFADEEHWSDIVLSI